MAGNDLLDLSFDAPATAQDKKPQTSTLVSPATEISTSADTFADDEFDGFQSAVPATGATAPAAGFDQLDSAFGTSAAPAPAAAAETAAAISSAVTSAAPPAEKDAAVSFDPLATPAPAPAPAAPVPEKAPEPADPFGNLDALDKPTQATSASPAPTSFNEFDPVKQEEPPALAPWEVDTPAPAPAAAAPAASSNAGGGGGDLLGLGGVAEDAAPDNCADDDLEDSDKKVVFVYYKGEKSVVGWYADMDSADIKEAVLCACDSIIDGGFVLREVQFNGEDETAAEPKEDGRVFEFEDFDKLENGQTYIIEGSQEREDLKKFTGDRWRRLKVQVEPLMHVEANKAIDRMRRGSNLLKHTHYGFPHLRQFQLSDDRKRLVWYSGAKRKEDSVVQLEDLIEIRLGQTTPVFLHYRLPMLEHLSFSLVYGDGSGRNQKTLDLTCKDEFEFDHWVTGLKAIFYHFKNKQISKEQLLGHSKRFRKALEKNNVGIKLTKLPEVKEKGHVGLDDCIEIVAHTPQQLDTKMERLRERLKTMSQNVARLDHHAAAEMEVDLSLLTGQGPAYASVFAQDEEAQDEEMEIRRMHELVDQTTQVLQQARNELIALNQKSKGEASGSGETNAAKAKKKENAACKQIDQLLWKAEVDLENVEDMYLRHIDNQRDTATPLSISVAELSQKLQRAASDVEESWSRTFTDMRNWFSQ